MALALATRYPALSNPAFHPDNILSLSLGERSIDQVFAPSFGFRPYYRPVAFLSVWLEYAIHGMSGIPLYFLVNVLLLGLCVHVFTLVLFRAGTGLVPGLLAGVFFAVHPNTISLGTTIAERQNTLAMLFGFLAILAWCSLAQGPEWNARGSAVVFIFLLLSAFSKEIGLAFSFAVFVGSLWMAWQHGCRSLAWAAGAALLVVVIVLGLSLSIVGLGPVMTYDECRAFFTECWTASYPELGWARTAGTLLYTGGANVVAAFFPFAFENNGALRAPQSYGVKTVAFFLVYATAAVMGMAKAPRHVTVLAVALILGHGLASAPLFRFRNHMPSDAAAIVLVCFGLKALLSHRSMRPGLRAVCVAILVSVLAYRGYVSNQAAVARVERERGIDPERARVYVPVGASQRVIEIQHARFVRAGAVK